MTSCLVYSCSSSFSFQKRDNLVIDECARPARDVRPRENAAGTDADDVPDKTVYNFKCIVTRRRRSQREQITRTIVPRARKIRRTSDRRTTYLSRAVTFFPLCTVRTAVAICTVPPSRLVKNNSFSCTRHVCHVQSFSRHCFPCRKRFAENIDNKST